MASKQAKGLFYSKVYHMLQVNTLDSWLAKPTFWNTPLVSSHAQLATNNNSILSLTQTITALCKERDQKTMNHQPMLVFFVLKMPDSGFPFLVEIRKQRLTLLSEKSALFFFFKITFMH